jgi:hypothetical protein
MAEYGSMFMVGGLAAILFFGGWHGPIPIFGPQMLDWAYRAGETEPRILAELANLAGCASFIFKSVVGVTLMMWVRWTLPRLRIDQVITMCLKYCVPIAAVCFAGVAAWQVGFGLRQEPIRFANDLAPISKPVRDPSGGEPVLHPRTGKPIVVQGRGGVRESWVVDESRWDGEPAELQQASREPSGVVIPPDERKGGDS